MLAFQWQSISFGREGGEEGKNRSTMYGLSAHSDKPEKENMTSGYLRTHSQHIKKDATQKVI